MKKIPLLPNIITAFGLTCGLFAIFKMNMTGIGEVNYHLLSIVTGFLLLAAFADLFDGAVARALKVESEFGGLFDSLADAISFGLAPPIIILKSLSVDPGTEVSFLVTSGALIYSMCGVLRLVRFNVMSNAEKGDAELAAANKKNFTGLPIPAAAAATVSANLIFFTDRFNQLFDISSQTHALLMFLVMVTCGYFMISRWKFPSAKSLRVRIASFRRVFLMVIAVVLIFYGMLNHFAWVFFGLSWSYLAVAWTLSLVRLISGKRLKTLEDYEPEPEDELDE